MAAWGNSTAERGNIGRRVPGMLHHGTTAPGTARPPRREKDRPARPVLTRSHASCSASVGYVLFSVCSAWLQPAAQWVRGPPCRPAGTRTGANAASFIRRASRQADCPWSATETDSVTQPQPGGSASSVEPVDCIGMLLSIRGNGGCSGCRSLLTSIHLALHRVNPTRTGHSRRPWWRVRPSRELHIAVI